MKLIQNLRWVNQNRPFRDVNHIILINYKNFIIAISLNIQNITFYIKYIYKNYSLGYYTLY
jgi:hypothetical protein